MPLKAFIILFFSSVFLFSCSNSVADKIVNKSIAFHGMERLNRATMELDFRKFHLKARQNDGQFTYERLFTDSTGDVQDILSNTGFKRLINGKLQKLDAKKTAAYTESVNAMFYFVYLPLKLNDGSVVKKYLGETTINKKLYYKIEVSFKQEGGGEDFDDIYYYWFDKEDYSMDFLAYSTGGNRFRAVSKVHEVDGIVFQDYINYQSPLADSVTPLLKYDSLYNAGKLRELSKIENLNIKVE